MVDANTSQPPEDLCIDDVIKFLTVRTEEKTEAILSLWKKENITIALAWDEENFLTRASVFIQPDLQRERQTMIQFRGDGDWEVQIPPPNDISRRSFWSWVIAMLYPNGSDREMHQIYFNYLLQWIDRKQFSDVASLSLMGWTVVKAWDPESPEWKRFRPVFEKENGIIYYKRESGEEMWLWVDGRFYSEGFISLLAAKLLRIMKTS